MSAQMTLNALATSAQYEEHAEFWTATLQSLPEDFHLQQNWQAYALPLGPAPEYTLEIESDARETLTTLSQGKDLNAFVILLAALFTVLEKYSGSAQVFIHTPPLAAEGSASATASIPIAAGRGPEGSIREYLNRIRAIVQSSYSLQNFPIAALAAKLSKRAASTNVQVCFEGLHASPVRESGNGYDLSITIQHRGGYRIALSGKPTCFTLHYLQHLARHWLNVVAAFRHREAPITAVALLDAAERARLLRFPDSIPVERTVLDVFAERVRQAPDHIAIATASTQLNYRELDDRATRLAYFLATEYGVQPGDAVGVLSDRSERWIVGVLGALKAGAVYVPLDPQVPQERIRHMIEDANVRALLIHSEYMHLLTDLWTIPMFALDFQLTTLEPPPRPLAIAVDPDAAAYIIYTSGSTGLPKGVVATHRGLANMALHHVAAFGFDRSERFAQFYSPAFDGSLMEIFTTLTAGARLVLAHPDVIRNVPEFSAYLVQQGVTTLNAAPAYLNTLDWSALGCIKRVISAGDNARVEDASRLSRTRTCHNSYGPTEASVCITDYVVDPAVAYGGRIPVGKPISNARIYLLDQRLDLAPEGCVGEICVSGIVLARGYLHRDELTAAAFVPHPFEPGERLYRTGDFGVWLPDGNLEVIGRRDGQVKIRGYRIELGEIEAALIQHPDVREAVVLVREDPATQRKWLLACVAAEASALPGLREHLQTRLPEFMVPQAIVAIGSMPRTVAGKVDRKALAALPFESQSSRSEYAAPGNEVEQRLGEIWADVLGRERIGIHDNFFELGGDSILIIQIVARAQQAGIGVTAQQHFIHPTLAALAKVAVAAAPAPAAQEPVTGRAGLTPIQHWFFSQEVADPHHYNQSFMAEVPGTLAPAVIAQALTHILEHHDALRLSYFRAGGSWEQIHAAGPLAVPVPTTELAGLAAAEQDRTIRSVAARLQESFDLSQAPLLRAHLFLFAPGEASRLLLIAHHLVIDGVSWRILLEDLHTVCRQIEGAEAIRLPDKTTSFQDWSARLERYSSGAIDGLDYWLENAAATPSGFANVPLGTIGAADSIVVRIEDQHTRALLQDVPRALNTQINEALLTALVLAFRDWTGDSALLVELEGHGRDSLFDDLDVSRTIGWFTSHHPVLLNAGSGASTVEVLRTVQEQLRAVPRRGTTYGIARYLHDDPERTATFERQLPAPVRFNYLGQIDRVLTDSGGWKPVFGFEGPEHSPRARRSHLFEIEGVVFEGCLQLTWTYNTECYARADVERLTQLYRDRLLSLRG